MQSQNMRKKLIKRNMEKQIQQPIKQVKKGKQLLVHGLLIILMRFTLSKTLNCSTHIKLQKL